MKKLITVTYGFDNLSEFPYFERSLYTLVKHNGNLKKYMVLIIVKDELIKQIVNSHIINNYPKLNFKIEIPNSLDDIKKVGKFYWLLSPFFTKTKYTLQLDNDVLLNTKLTSLILNAKKNNPLATIWGVRIKVSPNWATVQSITGRENFNYDADQIHRWINGGVVLIKNPSFKKVIKNLSSATEKLNDFFNDELHPPKENIKRTLSDEAFVYLYFCNRLAKLSRRFNLRVQTPITTKKWINKKNTIFHYNLRRKENNKYLKFSFDEILKNRNFSNDNKIEMKEFINKIDNPDRFGEIDKYVDDIAKLINQLLD